MYEKGLTLWSILFFYTERSRIVHRAKPDCTPSEDDCTPSGAEVSRMSTMLEIQGGVS